MITARNETNAGGNSPSAFVSSVVISIFSMKMPYPVVGSFIKTCVTAPTSLPFWMMGLPLRCVVNKGQQFLEFYMILIGNIYSVFQYHYTYKFFTLYLRFYGDTTLGR